MTRRKVAHTARVAHEGRQLGYRRETEGRQKGDRVKTDRRHRGDSGAVASQDKEEENAKERGA